MLSLGTPVTVSKPNGATYTGEILDVNEDKTRYYVQLDGGDLQWFDASWVTAR